MYHHVVTFQFKSDVADAGVESLAKELTQFASTITGLVSYACGPDLGVRENSDDFAIAAVFETAEAMQTYLDHPEHHAIVGKYVPTMVEDKHSTQFRAQ